jgi:hypothetical protein
MPSKRNSTLESFSWIISLVCLGVLASFAILKMSYSASDDSIGMPPEAAGIVLSAFIPLVIVTLMGLRDRLAKTLLEGDAKPTPVNRRAYSFLLLLGLLGPVCGFLVMIFLSTGLVKVNDASWWVGGAASMWGGTTAYVLSKIDKKFPLA